MDVPSGPSAARRDGVAHEPLGVHRAHAQGPGGDGRCVERDVTGSVVALDDLPVVEHLGLDRGQPDEGEVARRLDAGGQGPEAGERGRPLLAGARGEGCVEGRPEDVRSAAGGIEDLLRSGADGHRLPLPSCRHPTPPGPRPEGAGSINCIVGQRYP